VKLGGGIVMVIAEPDDPSFATPFLPDPFGDWQRPQLHPVSQVGGRQRLTHQQSDYARFHRACLEIGRRQFPTTLRSFK
jgi:hypothetical protein